MRTNNKKQETRPHHTLRRRPERGGEVCLPGQRRQQRWKNRRRHQEPDQPGQTCIQHPPPQLELFSPLPPQQDHNLQHQRQFCPSVWLQNMENYQVKHPHAQTFINRCLRNIINIRWPDVISNADLWVKTGLSPIEVEIRKRKWGWIGHTLRKSPSNVTKQGLAWSPRGKRKVGDRDLLRQV